MADEILVENQRFEDLIVLRQYRPNPTLVRMINERTFPFSENEFFRYNPIKLAAEEYNRCVELYVQRGRNATMHDTGSLMGELIEQEAPNRKELQDLAIDLVREMYNVPDDFDLKALLEMPQNDAEEGGFADGEAPEMNRERKDALKPAIEKRRILNTIVHGAAIHQWTSAFYIVADKLNDIDPELLPKYNKLSAAVNFWNWSQYQGEMFAMGMQPMLQGYNKVDVTKKEIKAVAMNFPVLIHELSKGVIDFLVTKGIPTTFVLEGVTENITEDDLKYIYKEADKYSHEQWHYCFGPSLWRAMLDTADVTSHDLPPIISHMSQMSYEDLASFCINITFHQEELGKKEMDAVKKEAY